MPNNPLKQQYIKDHVDLLSPDFISSCNPWPMNYNTAILEKATAKQTTSIEISVTHYGNSFGKVLITPDSTTRTKILELLEANIGNTLEEINQLSF